MLKYFSLLLTTIFILLLVCAPNQFIFADDTSVSVKVDVYQCNDGADNDSDNKIDYPNDPGCSSSIDNDETDPLYCGDGTCNNNETCSSCSADCGSCPSGGGGGGGGGSGAYVAPAPLTATVIFSGRAYPKSSVTLLKDARVAATSIAGPDANFEIKLTGLTAGNYIFSLYSEDYQSKRSILITFPVSLTAGATTEVSGIFIAPTIGVDKSIVRRGDDIAIFGQSIPQSDIVININSEEEFFVKTIADKNGIYLYNFDTAVLEYGTHYAKSKASIGNLLISGYGSAVNFLVSTKTVMKEELKIVKADLSKDEKINLIDFSILAYWYKRPLTQEAKIRVDLNNDGKVDLVDFSIMAYYWTG